MKDDLLNWKPADGDPNPMRMVNGEWFDTECMIERECYERGFHRWGEDKFADEAGVQGWHKCVDCFRIEPL